MLPHRIHANSILVVVPCVRSKIWSKQTSAGPTLAKDAYTGSPFKVNRRYAGQSSRSPVYPSARRCRQPNKRVANDCLDNF